MLNKAIDISVVVVTFNQQNSIPQTLDSILSQRHGYSIEIIIGEDGSSDNTRAVCEQYAAQHPETIKLMPKAPNKGVLRNYADCLSVCRGKYIASCAGDDWWNNPAKLQMQVDFLENNPDYGVVHTNVDTFDQQKEKMVPAKPRNPPQGNVYKKLFKYNFIFAPTAIYKRSLLTHLDFDQLRGAGINIEDYPMWLEFARHCKIGYIDIPTVTYSVLEHSLSHSADVEKKLAFIEQTKKIRDFYLKKYPDSGVDAAYSDLFYYRTLYMELLTCHKYKRSFEYVDRLGFSKPLQIVLKTYVGAWLCSVVIGSKMYKNIKQL